MEVASQGRQVARLDDADELAAEGGAARIARALVERPEALRRSAVRGRDEAAGNRKHDEYGKGERTARGPAGGLNSVLLIR